MPLIEVHGQSYELPTDLMACPMDKCEGRLLWDGIWSWACDSQNECGRGLSLAAIFADDDLDMKFTMSRPQIETLLLTPDALLLAEAGTISLSWLTTPRQFAYQLALAKRCDYREEEIIILQQLMRKIAV